MMDPEIQAIMQDPVFMSLIKRLQENPRDQTVLDALKDPAVATKFQKLVTSGVIQLGGQGGAGAQ